MVTKVLYRKDGFVILAGNPFPDNSPLRKEQANLTDVIIYRCGDYAFRAHIPMNKYGMNAAIIALASIGIETRYNVKTHEYIMSNKKAMFEFMLKHGAFTDK